MVGTVKAAAEVLANALAGLKEKPVEKPIEAPATGDQSMVMVYAIMMFAAVLVFVKKRRQA